VLACYRALAFGKHLNKGITVVVVVLLLLVIHVFIFMPFIKVDAVLWSLSVNAAHIVQSHSTV
jgi:accessory gene regulator protein AgrB